MAIKVGFTGTERGMTDEQLAQLECWLGQMGPVVEFHHGDCIGADAEAHDLVIAVEPNCDIQIHPPLDPKKRAWKDGCCWEAKPYLTRNLDIVRETDVLVACPRGRRGSRG